MLAIGSVASSLACEANSRQATVESAKHNSATIIGYCSCDVVPKTQKITAPNAPKMTSAARLNTNIGGIDGGGGWRVLTPGFLAARSAFVLLFSAVSDMCPARANKPAQA